MSDVIDQMPAPVRRQFADLASEVGCDPAALIVPVISAYLVLYRDARGALPKDPLHSLAVQTRKGGKK